MIITMLLQAAGVLLRQLNDVSGGTMNLHVRDAGMAEMWIGGRRTSVRHLVEVICEELNVENVTSDDLNDLVNDTLASKYNQPELASPRPTQSVHTAIGGEKVDVSWQILESFNMEDNRTIELHGLVQSTADFTPVSDLEATCFQPVVSRSKVLTQYNEFHGIIDKVDDDLWTYVRNDINNGVSDGITTKTVVKIVVDDYDEELATIDQSKRTTDTSKITTQHNIWQAKSDTAADVNPFSDDVVLEPKQTPANALRMVHGREDVFTSPKQFTDAVSQLVFATGFSRSGKSATQLNSHKSGSGKEVKMAKVVEEVMEKSMLSGRRKSDLSLPLLQMAVKPMPRRASVSTIPNGQTVDVADTLSPLGIESVTNEANPETPTILLSLLPRARKHHKVEQDSAFIVVPVQTLEDATSSEDETESVIDKHIENITNRKTWTKLKLPKLRMAYHFPKEYPDEVERLMPIVNVLENYVIPTNQREVTIKLPISKYQKYYIRWDIYPETDYLRITVEPDVTGVGDSIMLQLDHRLRKKKSLSFRNNDNQ